jgi:uncharacterized ubiquitin-like protein YukD
VGFVVLWYLNQIVMKLTHKFSRRSSKESQIELSECSNLKSLIKTISAQSEKQNPDRYDPLLYKGDAFEWFAEFFFKFFNGDNFFLKVSDYNPIKGSDYGVDGIGLFTEDNSKKVAIQVKYKSNTNRKLSSNEDNLSNFGVHAYVKHNIEIDSKYLIVFTSASGIKRTTLEGIYQGQITCINYELISKYVDNNDTFWRQLKSSCVS